MDEGESLFAIPISKQFQRREQPITGKRRELIEVLLEIRTATRLSCWVANDCKWLIDKGDTRLTYVKSRSADFPQVTKSGLSVAAVTQQAVENYSAASY